jgi:hypothetical protein
MNLIELVLHSLNPKQVNTLDTEQDRRNITYIYTVIAGIMQLIKLSLSFCVYVKVFTYRVEGMST